MADEDIEQKADASSIKNIRARLVYAGRGKPDPTQNLEDELLDWDAHIDSKNLPPPHFSQTIKATFKYVGRSKPIPLDDPYM